MAEELKAPVFATTEEAEEAFYAAFEQADVDTMMSVWADDAHITCIHPIGPRLEGQQAIRDSWQAIFSKGRPMRFRVTDHHRAKCDTLAVHIVYENFQSRRGDKPHPPVVATNIYRLTDDGWRMILHHASPTPEGAREQAPTLH